MKIQSVTFVLVVALALNHGQRASASNSVQAKEYYSSKAKVQLAQFREAQPATVSGDDIESRLRAVDAMITQKMAEQNLPGYALTVIKSGKVVFQKPYGFADLQRQRPVTNDTVFGLASLTKTFTSIVLLSLVEKGLIGLDDPLGKYVSHLAPQYQNLTIRQLASMTAGVSEKVEPEVDWKNQLEALNRTPLQSTPGSAFLYSNFSFRLLGSAIEKASGKPYFEMVRNIVFAPLHMENSGTTVLLQNSGSVAQGYGDNQGKGPVRPLAYKDPAVSFSAGMLASTNHDMTKYVLALMQRKMLSPESFRTLWYDRPPLTTGAPSKWAFGWAGGLNKNLGQQYCVSMNGGTAGVASTIIILPEDNSAIVALANLRKPEVYAIARTAAKIAFGSSSKLVEDDDSKGSAGE